MYDKFRLIPRMETTLVNVSRYLGETGAAWATQRGQRFLQLYPIDDGTPPMQSVGYTCLSLKTRNRETVAQPPVG